MQDAQVQGAGLRCAAGAGGGGGGGGGPPVTPRRVTGIAVTGRHLRCHRCHLPPPPSRAGGTLNLQEREPRLREFRPGERFPSPCQIDPRIRVWAKQHASFLSFFLGSQVPKSTDIHLHVTQTWFTRMRRGICALHMRRSPVRCSSNQGRLMGEAAADACRAMRVDEVRVCQGRKKNEHFPISCFSAEPLFLTFSGPTFFFAFGGLARPGRAGPHRARLGAARGENDRNVAPQAQDTTEHDAAGMRINSVHRLAHTTPGKMRKSTAPQAPLVQKAQLRGQGNAIALYIQQPAKPTGAGEHEQGGECMQNASDDAFLAIMHAECAGKIVF
eukprot:gene25899-biopygen6040